MIQKIIYYGWVMAGTLMILSTRNNINWVTFIGLIMFLVGIFELTPNARNPKGELKE